MNLISQFSFLEGSGIFYIGRACTIIYKSQDVKNLNAHRDRMKEEVAHIYNGPLYSHKKNGIMPFATQQG